MKNYILNFLSIPLFLLSIAACENETQLTAEEYVESINEWHSQRIAALKQADSWLSLAGLYQLEEGTQSIGSDSASDIIFPPKAPAQLGTISLKDSVFTLSIHPDAVVTRNGSPVTELVMQSDAGAEPTVVKHGSYLWYIIERRGNYYIRLKNTEHPNFASFAGIERFPVSRKWRIKAEFKPFEEPKLISIPDVLGDVYQDTLYGTLEFTIRGESYDLAPLGNPQKDEEFFIILGDETNGKTTYGGGRYIYVDTPNENGITYIDFNKAYNPPCVFTKFATCPLPPVQNRLPVKITAGEKMYKISEP